MLDWAAHLEYLQFILLEYDPFGVSTKPTMLKYFQVGLKLLVLVELEYQDLELGNFNQMVKKSVNAKTKLALRLCSSTKEIDQNYSWGNQPANFTVAKS